MVPLSPHQSAISPWVGFAGRMLLEIAILLGAWISALLGAITAMERAKLVGGEGFPAAMAEV